MNEKEFITFFASLLDENVEELTLDTEFRYLDQWTSMAGLCFITDMKEKYGKVITVKEFKDSETLEDLYHLYQEK